MERYDPGFYEMARQDEVVWEEDKFTNDCLLVRMNSSVMILKYLRDRHQEGN